MTGGIERCPHCIATPLVPRTNTWGGVYLECMDCGYYESVRKLPDPYPTPKRTRYQRGRKTPRKVRSMPPKNPPLSLTEKRRLAGKLGGLAKSRNRRSAA